MITAKTVRHPKQADVTPPEVAEAIISYIEAKQARHEALKRHEAAYGTAKSPETYAGYFLASERDNAAWKRLGETLRAAGNANAAERNHLTYRAGDWLARLVCERTGPMQPEVEYSPLSLAGQEGGAA